jgi:hypothetical protein
MLKDAYQDLIKPATIPGRRSRFLIQAMERMNTSVGKNNNAFRGEVFERAIHDMLLRENIPADSIWSCRDLCDRWPKLHTWCVDIDLAIVNTSASRYWPILAKTSLRERWKQCHRDVLLAKTCISWSMITPLVLFFKEHKEVPSIEVLNKSRQTREIQCDGHMMIYSIYDQRNLNRALKESLSHVFD